jgi:hypothetical protein
MGLLVMGCRSPATEFPPTPAPTTTSELTPLPKHTATPTPLPLQEGEAMTLMVVFDNNAFDPRLQTGLGVCRLGRIRRQRGAL